MSEHVYKKLELVGSSKDSIEDAVRNAIAAAGKSVNNVENGQVAHFQVVVKVGFRVDT